jgi:ATP-dependent helicase/nuclease subunit A
MATKWTDAQLNAIEARKSKILVSAAAGSGKTATLIERIIRSITTDTPPMDISRMLIVTFTRAAASELRLRIMKALGDAIQKDPDNIYFRRQMLLLESADISTIDSFCLDVMRSQIKSNDSEYDFRVGDENELKLLRSNAMNDALESVLKSEQFRDRNDGTVYEFLSVLGGTRNDNELIDNLLEIYDEIINTPEGIDYISEYAKELADDSENAGVNNAQTVAALDADLIGSVSGIFLLEDVAAFREITGSILSDTVIPLENGLFLVPRSDADSIYSALADNLS